MRLKLVQLSKQAVARTVYDEIVKGIPNGDGTSRFAPKKTATRAEAAAFISRMLNAADKVVEEEPPVVEEPPVQEPPVVEEPPVQEEPIEEPPVVEQPPVEEEPVPEEETDVYKVATIDANKNLVPGTQSYDTYNEAKNAVTDSNQVVIFNDEIVNMSAGLVISSPPAGKYLTYIYADKNFTTNITYITAQQEMEFLESNDEYVKVNVAGTTAYVKQSEVDLLPYQQVEDRNYYSINGDGDLVHNIYNQKTKAKASYVMGKAPSFLKAGNKYYSWDGGVFYNNAGVNVGEGYQYFNYLPARTVSNYTAAELDRYINARLAELESLYETNPTTFARYKDATELSKLKDLGTYIKEAESKYKINALLILAMAMHESDYGMSVFSQERNNLFGLKAYDSNLNQAETFADPSEAIDGLATRYLNKNYINPNPDPKTDYANGAVLGNKSGGFNVKYASDPYWGQKIAGHMYRVDKFLGSEDLGEYQIGVTNTKDLNVRHSPEVTAESVQFTYKKSGMPVVKVDSTTQADGSIWYKVISDHNDYNEGYIYSIYVEDMKLVK